MLLVSAASAQTAFEAGVKVGFQKPKFWTGSFLDVTTSKDTWVRPFIGGYGKFHMNENLFVEYDLDISWEGGGFEKRRTNLTVLKNTFFLGASTNSQRANSVNFKIGFGLNNLLSAEFNDEYTGTKSDVKPYFKKISNSIPFSLGYSRRLKNDYRIGTNVYFQLLSGPLSTQKHIPIAQTFQRTEITISKYIR